MALQRQPSSTPSASVKLRSEGFWRSWKAVIRSWATASAASAAGSQAARAAAISAWVMRRPEAARSTLSNRAE